MLSDAPTAPHREVLIHARDLTKSHGDVQAVRGIDVDVLRGESFGFLGPNGAGKSSTMKMIACTSPPTSGTLRILGHDPAEFGSTSRPPASIRRLGMCSGAGCRSVHDGPGPPNRGRQ